LRNLRWLTHWIPHARGNAAVGIELRIHDLRLRERVENRPALIRGGHVRSGPFLVRVVVGLRRRLKLRLLELGLSERRRRRRG
jgi:hypothetical protein